MGNPVSYLGATLTWEGRTLTSYEDETRKVQYEYDENGMRYRTTVTDKEEGWVGSYEYVWADGKLVSMVYVSDGSTATAKYIYNDFEEPVGMVVTNDDGSVSTCYYLKNAQGDITHIVSSSGRKLLEFTYDAFGKQTVHFQADLSTMAGLLDLVEQVCVRSLTPFGYRGYCYDAYSGMYYLQSRYYDPQTGRFINADDTNYLNATGTVLGCNLFAYCENDPVNYIDETGTERNNINIFANDFAPIYGSYSIRRNRAGTKYNVILGSGSFKKTGWVNFYVGERTAFYNQMGIAYKISNYCFTVTKNQYNHRKAITKWVLGLFFAYATKSFRFLVGYIFGSSFESFIDVLLGKLFKGVGYYKIVSVIVKVKSSKTQKYGLFDEVITSTTYKKDGNGNWKLINVVTSTIINAG